MATARTIPASLLRAHRALWRGFRTGRRPARRCLLSRPSRWCTASPLQFGWLAGLSGGGVVPLPELGTGGTAPVMVWPGVVTPLEGVVVLRPLSLLATAEDPPAGGALLLPSVLMPWIISVPAPA